MIRTATADDIARLAEIHAASFPEAWDAAAFAALLAGEGVVALIDAEGFVLIRTVADEAEILSIAVDPQSRQRGVATSLLTAATATARAAGAQRLFLEVSARNVAALALYRRAGFTEIGLRRRYYADGADAHAMALTLS